MAKSKKASKKKDGTLTLPKQIAGVKIPKKLRKQAEQWAELARNPIVVDILAVGLTAMAAKMSASLGKKTDGHEPAAKPGPRPVPRRPNAGSKTAH